MRLIKDEDKERLEEIAELLRRIQIGTTTISVTVSCYDVDRALEQTETVLANMRELEQAYVPKGV